MMTHALNEKWLAGLLFAAGIGLFLAPWLAGFSNDPEPFVSTIVLSLLLFVLGTAAAADLPRVASGGAMTAAAWSLLVPVLLDLDGHAAFWIHILAGVVVMLIGIAGSVVRGGDRASGTEDQPGHPGPIPAWLMIRGALAIALGILALIFPAGALFAFTMLFAAFALADGMLSIASVLGRGGDRQTPWWAAIARGLVGVLVAVIFLIMPWMATITYALAALGVLAAWSILTGIFEIATAVRLRREIEGEWLLGLSGLLSILLGLAIPVLMYFYPDVTILSVGWMIGVYAIAVGIALIVQGARLAGGGRPSSKEKSGIPDPAQASAT
jgi:uncharacterized membrane protein HdeD (DUF308 family)